MRTIIFGNILTDIVCIMVILFLWRQSRKRFAGMGFLVFDFALQTAAMLLIILRGSIPDWMSMVVSNTLVIAGAILGYMGLGCFVGKKVSQVHNYVLLAVFTCVHAYFALVQPSLAARTLNISAALLIICFQCMWLLLYRVEPAVRRLTLGVGMVFGAYCLVGVIRIVGFFTGGPAANSFFHSGAFEPLVLISYQMLFILLTYSLALMVSKRFLFEVETQEEKFAKAFRSSPYAIILTRLSDGQIVEVNDGFVNIAGYPAAEVMGKTTIDLHLWDEDEDRRAVVDELSRGRKVQGREFQFRKKSGERITGLFSADIIHINNQPFVLSSINDITERKKMEEALRKSKERWATTLASIGDAVISTDVEGRITFMNAVAETLTGWELAEASTKPVTDVFKIINEDTRREVENPAGRVLLEGKVVGLANHTVLIRKDGTEVAVDDSGAPIKDERGNVSGVVLVFRDITERKRAEEQLRESEERSRLLIKYAPSMFYEIDFNRPAFKSVNDVMCQFLGCTREELLRMNPFDLLDDEGKALFRERTKRRLAGEAIPDSVEYKSKTKDGREVCGVLNMTFTYRDGKPEGAVVVAHDITERKRAEEALKKAHDELEIRVQERTSELSEAVQRIRAENIQRKRLEETLRESEAQVRFFASQCLTAQETERKRVAGELHDTIAASLSAVKMGIEKAAEELRQGRGSAESLQDLNSMVSAINNDVRRIMADLRPSILDDLGIIAAINWFCREYQKIYSHVSVENRIGISEHEVPDSLKTPIFRISQEALNNIAKHSKATLVNLRLQKANTGIELMIQDNGQGFDPDTVRKGLGLSTMRERAQLSGGSFDVETAIGKGTTIRASWTI
jgi:PAS domain S-box-containing protein